MQDYLFGAFIVLVFIGVTMFLRGQFLEGVQDSVIRPAADPDATLEVNLGAVDRVRSLTAPFPPIILPDEEYFGKENPFVSS